MSLKEIAKHAATAAVSHIAKVDADHDRMEWLEQHTTELQYVHARVQNEDCTVREAIDWFRKRREETKEPSNATP